MDILQQLQLDIAGLLNSAPAGTALAVYQHVPVIVFRPRTKADGSVEDAVMIENTISQALAGITPKNGKSGLAAIVMMPDVGIPAEMEKLKGTFLQLEASIRIIEDPLINMGDDGVGVTAEQLALDTLAVLHGWYPRRTQIPLRGRDRAALAPYTIAERPMQVAWDINLITRHHLQPMSGTIIPTITQDGTLPAVEVAITCEEGADIYYTRDGSFPSAANPEAAIFTIPFAVTAATTVRAVGYLANCLPSSVAEADIA